MKKLPVIRNMAKLRAVNLPGKLYDTNY